MANHLHIRKNISENGLLSPPLSPLSRKSTIRQRNEDYFEQFRGQTVHKRHKLRNILGVEAEVDVSVAEIEIFGLRALLMSRIPLTYFLHKLLLEHASETMFFYLEVENFERLALHNIQETKKGAHHIYQTYLDTTSQLEVNVDDRVRRDIERKLISSNSSEQLRLVFTEAKVDCFAMLEQTFNVFIRSESFAALKRDMGNGSILMTEENRNLAFEQLQSYVRKIESNQNHSISDLRLEIIRHMIHEFSKTMLGI